MRSVRSDETGLRVNPRACRGVRDAVSVVEPTTEGVSAAEVLRPQAEDMERIQMQKMAMISFRMKRRFRAQK